MPSLSAHFLKYTGRFLEDLPIGHPAGLISGSSQVPRGPSRDPREITPVSGQAVLSWKSIR